MIHLLYQINDEPRSFLVVKDRITIGRMGDNDLVLPDHTVSRNHAELVRTPAGWILKDLGSRNGSQVNGELIQEAPVIPGSLLIFGRLEVRMEEDGSSGVRIGSPGPEIPIGEGTIIRSVDEVRSMLSPVPALDDRALGQQDIDRMAKTSRILSVLSEVSRTLLEADTVDAVLEKIMDVIFQYVQAQRAVILLSDPIAGGLEPRSIRQLGDQKDTIQISRTIAQKAFSEGVAILSQDAQVDPRFQAGESIRFLGIRSALCVPLKAGDQVLGLIYVDSPMKVKAFQEFDLDLLSALSGYAAVGIRQAALRAAIEHERIAKSRLERYHSPSVVERIVTGGAGGEDFRLDVRELESTILFADIVGFTTMSENMAARDVSTLLNAYFSTMTDVIFTHEGTLDKFIGDCIMAIFGAPIPSRDHAVRAVRAALEMREALAEFNEQHSSGPQLDFRIGINTGSVVAGDIGSLRRMEYSVLGSTVNAASRLQSQVAEPGQIVIGEITRQQIGESFDCRKIGDVKVKGLRAPLPCYEVMGEFPEMGDAGKT
jgi:adenylate cyclase